MYEVRIDGAWAWTATSKTAAQDYARGFRKGIRLKGESARGRVTIEHVKD